MKKSLGLSMDLQKRFSREFKLFENKLVKIPGSWGHIDEICKAIYIFRRLKKCSINQRVNIEVLLFISSNGVIDAGVSNYNSVTEEKVYQLIDNGQAPINYFSSIIDCSPKVIDVGVNSNMTWKNIDSKKIRKGTRNITIEDAMTTSEFLDTIDVGRACAKKYINKQTDIVCLGEMGLGNTTTSSVIIAILLGLTAEQVCGSGTGISENKLKLKKNILQKLIDNYKKLPGYTFSNKEINNILRKFGGFEIVAEVAFILETVKSQCLILIDGYITSVAAYIAYLLDSEVGNFLVFASYSVEPGHKYILEAMNRRAILDVGLCMGQCTGSLFLANMLRPALNFYFAS